jgi:DNA polymerase III subunit gamma/tau
MSYTVLARKWRPRRFDELVGQQHVVKALMNSLAAGRLHHAYLFSGTRGVGKTTLARILAKALNCTDGVVAEPCGSCDACTSIDEGRFVDLIEVDAASRTKVDDTRELLENVQYAPSRGRFKVYLIDEVHMLSTHSFNALLKTLEEPPPHVKFLLATTDPQKLPVTVLSRCLQFNLKRLTLGQIQDQLQKICDAEDMQTEPAGLAALAKGAEGSMRDALSLLDQAIAFSGGEVSQEAADSMLGSIDRSHVLRLLEGLSASDGSAMLNEVAALDEFAPDYGSILDELMGELQRLAVIQVVGFDEQQDAHQALQELAATMSKEDVQLYYQIALQGRRDLSSCRDPRSGVEMTLLRMLAFRPGGGDATERQPPAQANALSARSAAKPPKVAPATSSDTVSSVSADPVRAAARSITPPRDQDSSTLPPLETDGRAASGETTSTIPINTEESGAGAAQADFGEWNTLLDDAEIHGAARQLAEHCTPKDHSKNRISLVLAAESAHLNTVQVKGRLESDLAKHIGRGIKIEIVAGTPPAPTPAQLREEGEDQRMRQAREAIAQDPNVQAVQAAFDAVVESSTIRPMGK